MDSDTDLSRTEQITALLARIGTAIEHAKTESPVCATLRTTPEFHIKIAPRVFADLVLRQAQDDVNTLRGLIACLRQDLLNP